MASKEFDNINDPWFSFTCFQQNYYWTLWSYRSLGSLNSANNVLKTCLLHVNSSSISTILCIVWSFSRPFTYSFDSECSCNWLTVNFGYVFPFYLISLVRKLLCRFNPYDISFFCIRSSIEEFIDRKWQYWHVEGHVGHNECIPCT